MNFKRVMDTALLLLIITLLYGCSTAKVAKTSSDSESAQVVSDLNTFSATHDDEFKSDSVVQPYAHVERYSFTSEVEYKAALLSKNCPDDLAHHRIEHYVPKELPTGYTLGYINATKHGVGIYYFEKDEDGLCDDREFCFAWNDGWVPEYLESDIEKEGLKYEHYKEYFMMPFDKVLSVQWIQGNRVFYAHMPLDTPVEVMEAFCDAVRISFES